MSYQPIEKLLPKAGNSIYRLVRMAANRALELSEGKPTLIKKPSSEKETTVALEEIMMGKVVYKDAVDLVEAEKAAEGAEEAKE